MWDDRVTKFSCALKVLLVFALPVFGLKRTSEEPQNGINDVIVP